MIKKIEINFMDSVYESKKRIVEIQKVLKEIKTERWKKQIDEIRYHINNGDTKQADNIKRNLPAITISATFKEGGRTKVDVDTYTNLLHLDYDYIDNVQELKALQEKIVTRIKYFFENNISRRTTTVSEVYNERHDDIQIAAYGSA